MDAVINPPLAVVFIPPVFPPRSLPPPMMIQGKGQEGGGDDEDIVWVDQYRSPTAMRTLQVCIISLSLFLRQSIRGMPGEEGCLRLIIQSSLMAAITSVSMIELVRVCVLACVCL